MVVGLAVGIVILRPDLQMPAVTEYASTGKGPVWGGSLFPLLFITIACGAVSGFHALISSGTTPKMLARETEARLIGYGGMLMESFVAMMALIAASIIDPGVGFFAKANQLKAMLADGFVPSSIFQSESSVRQVILNNQIDGVLQAFFMIVIVAMVIFTIQSCRKAMASDQVTAKETPYEPLPANADDILRGHA